TVAVRLALRDLVRYQARSGAALGAVTLAIGIAATIAISAAAAEKPTGPGNLSSDQLMLYIAPANGINQIPPLSASQRQAANAVVARLATTLDARSVVPLEQAYNPQSSLQSVPPGAPGGAKAAGYGTASLAQVIELPHGEEITAPQTLYVASPALLSYYGIDP